MSAIKPKIRVTVEKFGNNYLKWLFETPKTIQDAKQEAVIILALAERDPEARTFKGMLSVCRGVCEAKDATQSNIAAVILKYLYISPAARRRAMRYSSQAAQTRITRFLRETSKHTIVAFLEGLVDEEERRAIRGINHFVYMLASVWFNTV
jgi:protein-disulfide isomerase-like protein with CxxC motif